MFAFIHTILYIFRFQLRLDECAYVTFITNDFFYFFYLVRTY